MSKLIEKYLEELRLNGARENTIITHRKILTTLNQIKALEKCTSEDLKAFLTNNERSKNTIAAYKTILRKFFIWQGKPEVVSWIQKIKREKKRFDADKLLTKNEIEAMLKTSIHPRDKCLIALLAESGCRISEIMALNLGDVREKEYGFMLKIPDAEGAKTGSRDVPVIDSAPYIKTWLNQYPQPAPEKPLFVSYDRNNYLQRLTCGGAKNLIKALAKNAGITKRVYPHLFRHTALTEMVRQGYQESIIRKKAGWVGDSRMIATYLHACDRDVETAILAKQGLRHIQAAQPSIKLTKECPNCHRGMPVEAQYCENCSKHQDLSPVVKRLIEENQAIMARVTTLEDLESKHKVADEALAAILEEVKKKKDDSRYKGYQELFFETAEKLGLVDKILSL